MIALKGVTGPVQSDVVLTLKNNDTDFHVSLANQCTAGRFIWNIRLLGDYGWSLDRDYNFPLPPCPI